MTILVGGVGELYQGDLDFGRRMVERLESEELGADVVVEDLHYGAVAVAQRLEDLRPATLVLVGAAERGRQPGTLERRVVERPERTPAELQAFVGDAITGYVTIDLVVEVAAGLDALPTSTVAIELEPVLEGPSEEISPEAEAALEQAVELVHAAISDARG